MLFQNKFLLNFLNSSFFLCSNLLNLLNALCFMKLLSLQIAEKFRSILSNHQNDHNDEAMRLALKNRSQKT